MPACAECRKMIGGNCQAFIEAQATLGRPTAPPPLGACMIPIAENYLKLIKKDMRVLEIGCGSWSIIKDYCEEVGAIYEGIDAQTEYFGKKTIATRQENLSELSFPDDYFDLILGMQTMEHWPEQNCSLKWGLYQCFRCCKYSGKVMLNVPMNFHGARCFMLGNLKRINRILQLFSSQVTFDQWGLPSDPLPPLIYYPGLTLRKKSAYVLDIHAIKDKPLSLHHSNSIYKGRWVFIKYAQIYPFIYCLYLVLKDLWQQIIPKYCNLIFKKRSVK